MFQLNESEINSMVSQNVICNDYTGSNNKNLKSQNVTSNKMGLRKKPYAFTEQGVSMLSAVLKSKRAIEISIKIMRAFVQMRHFIQNNASLKELGKKWFAFSKLNIELNL